MKPRATRHDFTDAGALAIALAQAVEDDLRAALRARGHASLVVSGGSTPRAFLRELARRDLEWSRVVVTLADERWLPPQHARSNQRMLHETLLQDAAAAARFVPLHRDGMTPEAAAAEVGAAIARMGMPFDVVVLGMGLDGHTASLFPDGDRLAEALDAHGTAWVSSMRAASIDEARITLTLPALVTARQLYLHIEGIDKLRAYAALDAASPLGAVLAAAPVDVYWAP